MFRNAIVLVAAVMLPVLHVTAGDFYFRVSTAPEWNQLFQKTNGWAGADVAYSIPLDTNKTVWFFGDTFVGRVVDGKRVHCRMIHSSLAIQSLGESPKFFYPTDKKHNPESLIKSPAAHTDFWLSDGARTDRGLFFFMQQVAWTGGGVWGFHCIGTWLGFVNNPDAPPAHWKITTKKMPFTTLADGEDAAFGAETLRYGGYIYNYGYANPSNSSAVKNLILARVPENEADNFSAWEFFSNGHWTKNFHDLAPIFSGAPPEGSVSWQPFLNKFVFVYTDGIWGTIVMRTADAPEGPWGPPTILYHCPEMRISKAVFCYAAKAHPELSANNELLISYASNSQALSEVLNDSRLYCPRFIRVTFENP